MPSLDLAAEIGAWSPEDEQAAQQAQKNGFGGTGGKWAGLFQQHGEGGRHNALKVFVGYLRAKSFEYEPGLLFAEVWNQNYCNPPLPQDEFRKLISAAYASWNEGGMDDTLPDGSRDIRSESRSVAEMLAIAVDPEKKLKWLAEGLIQEVGMTGLCGVSGHGKTWVALELCRHLSDMIAGGPFMGKYILPTKSVVYFEQDGNGEALIADRMFKLGYTAGNKNFVYREVRDILLDRPADRKTLLRIAKEHEAQFVVLDSLVAFHGKDENKSIEMRQVGKWIQDTFLANGIGVLYLHHDIKSASAAASEMEKTRGSGDIGGFTSSVLGLSQTKGIYTLTKRKIRGWPDQDTEAFRFCLVPGGSRDGLPTVEFSSKEAERRLSEQQAERDAEKTNRRKER